MANTSKTRREVITEFRQGEILRAARTVFAAQGFTAATMDLIAAEAGIAKGTLYLYFPGKEDIFWAAISSRLRELLEQTQRELASVVGARARIRRALQVRFGFLRSDEQFLRMYFTEFGQLCRPTAHFQPAFREVYMEAARFLAAVIEEGIRSGEIRPMPPMATAMALLDLSRDVYILRFLDIDTQAATESFGRRRSQVEDREAPKGGPLPGTKDQPGWVAVPPIGGTAVATERSAVGGRPERNEASLRAETSFDDEQFVFDLFWNGIAARSMDGPTVEGGTGGVDEAATGTR